MNKPRYEMLKFVVLTSVVLVSFLKIAVSQDTLPSGALLSSRAIAFNPATRKIYAVDRGQAAVFVINESSTSTSRVKVGAGPVAIATNSVTGRSYVANSDGGTVSVLDGQKDTVVATINVGALPT